MLDVFEGQELYLPPILAAMENAGISVDLDKLTANRVELQQRIALLEQRCILLPCLAQHVWLWALPRDRAEEWAGKKFLLSSPKQVADVLYNQLKLSPPSTPSQGKGVSQSPKKVRTTPKLGVRFRGTGWICSRTHTAHCLSSTQLRPRKPSWPSRRSTHCPASFSSIGTLTSSFDPTLTLSSSTPTSETVLATLNPAQCGEG